MLTAPLDPPLSGGFSVFGFAAPAGSQDLQCPAYDQKSFPVLSLESILGNVHKDAWYDSSVAFTAGVNVKCMLVKG